LFENQLEDKSAIYREKVVMLPRPEFFVLYNGPEVFPEYGELRLSDAFEKAPGSGAANMELMVKVYNINKGWNAALLARDENLGGYAEFVALVRKFQREIKAEQSGLNREMVLHMAIARAVSYCKEHGILRAFFERLSNEEVFMLTTEWNLEDAKKVWREEALEEGMERGKVEGKAEGQNYVLTLMKQGYSVEEIERQLNQQPSSPNTYR
jgi:hypothetical protein